MSDERESKRIADAIVEALFAPPTYDEAYPEGHPDEYQIHRWDLEKNIEKVAGQNELLGETLRALLQETDIVSEINEQFKRSVERSREELKEELRACIDEVVGDHVEFEAEDLKKRMDRVLDRHSRRIESLERWRDNFGRRQ